MIGLQGDEDALRRRARPSTTRATTSSRGKATASSGRTARRPTQRGSEPSDATVIQCRLLRREPGVIAS